MEELDVLGLNGSTLKNTFVIYTAVARGGFGVVYRGRHLSLEKDVAIKVFCPVSMSEVSVADEALQHFFQEIKILSALDHPAIVRPYDCGTIPVEGRGEVPWVALEWLDGQTLGELLRQSPARPWSPREVLDLLRPVMEALGEAHAHGIAHRDVAPNNIIVYDSGRGRRVRLIDFGIACIRPPYDETQIPEDESTLSGMIAHSPKYPAPEQLLGHRTGTWTDVHALGLIICHLLTGYLPYPGSARDPENGACALRRPTPGLVGVDVGAWEPVLSRAVAINPKARHANAQELLAELERTVEDAVPIDDEFEVLLGENWRIADVSPTPVPLLLNTPERTVILYAFAPSAEELRHGLELTLGGGLLCKLVITRYAEVSLALTVVGHVSERPGLYSTATGAGTRLTRVMLEPGTERSVFCGQRSVRLQEVICYTSPSDGSTQRRSIDLARLNLKVRFGIPIKEFAILQVNDPYLSQVHLACIGIP